MNPYGLTMTGSAVRPMGPRGIVRLSSGSDELQHYGVKGQKWGVITKEYEPVAVDKRKLKTSTPSINTYNKTFRPYPTRNQQLVPKEEKGWLTKKREAHNKALYVAGYAGAAAALLFVTYKAVKLSRITKAKAYSGILTRFLEQNPSASLNTESGRQLLQKGLKYAKSGSSKYYKAVDTNKYLKSIGANIKSKQASHIYSARRLIDRASKIGDSSNRYINSINRFRRQNLMRRIMDKLYF